MSAILRRRKRMLPTLRPVLEVAGSVGSADRGERLIPVADVAGSADGARAHDFDVSFLPVSRRLRDRWSRVYAALLRGETLPAIHVYLVDGRYFVIDGHHRVSAARELGRPHIRARVIEVTTAAARAAADAEAVLRSAEYAAFLAATGLDRVRPEAQLECSRLGRYDFLLAHVRGHRYFVGLERGVEVPIEEAAASWYDNVYLPVMGALRRHGILARNPGATEADLYVEVTRRWLELSRQGGEGGPDRAAIDLAGADEDDPPTKSPNP